MTTLIILATFLLAGTIKGVIGLGLPSVSLAILTVALNLESAMALLLAPSLVTNIWQAASGGHGMLLLLRLLGILIASYAIVSLFGLAFRVSGRVETVTGLLCGLANGVFTGMTGSSVVPGVMYLQSLELDREQFVQAMGILFSVSTAALALALWWQGRLPSELGTLSILAVLPALGGMIVGRFVRQYLSEQRFRRVFFSCLLLLGIYIVISSLL